MRIELFDVQAGFGAAAPAKGPDYALSEVAPDEWAREMHRLDIARALVRLVPDDLVGDVPAANEALYDACDRGAGLVPCPILVPNGGGDLPAEEEQVDAAVAEGAGAAFLRPQADYWSLAEWASHGLFAALEARRLPAFCLTARFTFDELAGLAPRYPGLPFILAGLQYRSDRTLIPFLKAFPNVHVSIGSNYTVHDGIERLVAEVGAGRVLFGTGFPEAEPMAAITQLAYARLDDDVKRQIGAGNLERLIGAIQR
ncbi:MAG: amidohydrolase family protein [Candidatus Hydrogenedentes bacterium]|nr:amidohydrolase family protein [Candidatus Hydrogenedentota bacterium]